jgi:hypothetical protein
MKSSRFPRRLAVMLGAVSLSVSAVMAAETSVSSPPVVSGSVGVGVSASVETARPRLPYGADDVLKLSRAQVSEDIIQNYIQNSGTVYNLTPNEIVYLRNEGVSDRVINTMLDQRKHLTEVAAQPAPASASDSVAAPAPNYQAPAPVYAAPEPVYAPPAPSSLYVMSYPQAASSYYGSYYPYYSGGYYPYYGGYYPYYGGCYGGYYRSPVISFGFRFGGGGSWGHHSHFSGGGGWHHR